jgi:flagellar assembly protein FliH
MAVTGKFLFNTSFDAPSSTPEARPAAPRFTEADLEQAREEAFAAGRSAGRAEARAEREELAARTLPAVAQALQGFGPMCERIERQTLNWALQAALAMVRKLYPSLERMQGLIEIEQMAIDALRDLDEEPRVVLRLPDSLIDEIKPKVTELCRQAGFGGRLLLIADETLGPGDCRLEWADGGIERQVARTWAEIEQRVARGLAAAPAASDSGKVDAEAAA